MELLNTLTLTASALACAVLLKKMHQRLQLSMAKHPSLGGHLRMSKRVAAWIPAYSYRDEQWFAADQAPQTVGHDNAHEADHAAERDHQPDHQRGHDQVCADDAVGLKTQ